MKCRLRTATLSVQTEEASGTARDIGGAEGGTACAWTRPHSAIASEIAVRVRRFLEDTAWTQDRIRIDRTLVVGGCPRDWAGTGRIGRRFYAVGPDCRALMTGTTTIAGQFDRADAGHESKEAAGFPAASRHRAVAGQPGDQASRIAGRRDRWVIVAPSRVSRAVIACGPTLQRA
jgi:hypothetical protein